MRYHFGPLHLDVAQGVLFHDREVVALPPKALDILLVLLEDAGAVVSRDTLRQRVWEDAFVEEANISKNVSVLRSVLRVHLGDVEAVRTISKRGYQFIAPVTVEDDAEGESLTVPDASPVVAVDDSHPEPQDVVLPVRSRFVSSIQGRISKRLRSALGLLAVLFIIAAIAFSRYSKAVDVSSKTPSRVSLAVFDPNDLSTDPDQQWLGTALQETLSTDLSHGADIRLVSADRTSRASQDLALPTLHTFDEHSVKAIAKRLDCDFAVVGFYLPAGNELRLDLQLRNARNGATIAEFTRIIPQDHLLQTVAEAGASFRVALGLPADLTIASPDLLPSNAVRDYTEGLRLYRLGDPIQAQPLLSKAVAADPHSALAHSVLSRVWHSLGYSVRMTSEAQLALDNAASLPKQQKLLVQARAYTDLNDWQHALDAYATLRHLYPDDPEYALALADAQIDASLYKDAAETVRQIRADAKPSHPPDPDLPLIEAYVDDGQGDFRSELLHAGQAIEQARAIGSRYSEDEALILEGLAWASLGDRPRGLVDFKRSQQIATEIHDLGGVAIALQRQGDILQKSNDPQTEPILQQALVISRQIGSRDITSDILNTLGNSHAELSDWVAAADFYRQALDLAIEIDSSNRQAIILSNLSSLELNIGQPAAAMRDAQRSLTLARSQGQLESVAASLNLVSAAEIYSGHLADAHLHLQQAIDISAPLGNPARTAELVQCMSVLDLQMGDIEAARSLAERVAASHLLNGSPEETRQINNAILEVDTRPESVAHTVIPPMTDLARQTAAPDNEAEAWRLVAESWFLQGNLIQAHDALNKALAVAKKSPYSGNFLLPTHLLAARLEIAEGHPAAALSDLAVLMQKAQRLQDAELQLEIRLAQADGKKKLGDTAAAARDLKVIQADATRQGFGLLARKAQRAALNS